MSKRGFWFISPFYDNRLISEFRRSHPDHAHLLENSIDAKVEDTVTGSLVGLVIGYLACGGRFENRLARSLPPGISAAGIVVRVLPIFAGCMFATASLGSHIGYNWAKAKNPHEQQDAKFQEAEAKFHDWLQNRAPAKSQFRQYAGYNLATRKDSHEQEDAKFHDWLQNRASARSWFSQFRQ